MDTKHTLTRNQQFKTKTSSLPFILQFISDSILVGDSSKKNVKIQTFDVGDNSSETSSIGIADVVEDFTEIAFCSNDELRRRLSSRLCIETQHQLFSLELNAFEVHSATNLRKRLHWHETSKLPFPEHRNSVVTSTPSSVPMCIDSSCDVISVV